MDNDWKIRDDISKSDFVKVFIRQPLIYVAGPEDKTVRYLWGPLIAGGTYLVRTGVLTDPRCLRTYRVALDCSPRVAYNDNFRVAGFSLFCPREYIMNVFSALIKAKEFIPVEPIPSPTTINALGRGVIEAERQARFGLIRSKFVAVQTVVEAKFSTLSNVCNALKDKMISGLFYVFEKLGLDTDGLWEKLCSTGSTAFNASIVALILGGLTYGTYRLVLYGLSKAKPEDEGEEFEYIQGVKVVKPRVLKGAKKNYNDERRRNRVKKNAMKRTLRPLKRNEMSPNSDEWDSDESDDEIPYVPCKRNIEDVWRLDIQQIVEIMDNPVYSQMPWPKHGRVIMMRNCDSEGNSIPLEYYAIYQWNTVDQVDICKRFEADRVAIAGEKRITLEIEFEGSIPEKSHHQPMWMRLQEALRALKIADFSATLNLNHGKHGTNIALNLQSLSTVKQGKVVRWSKQDVKSFNEWRDYIVSGKPVKREKPEDILNVHSINYMITDFRKNIIRHNQVSIHKVGTRWYDDRRAKFSTFGLGSKDKIFTVAHPYEMDGIYYFWRDGESTAEYNLAKVITVDYTRDLAVMQILGRDDIKNQDVCKMVSNKRNFPDLSSYFVDTKTILKPEAMQVVVWLPNSQMEVRGEANYHGLQTFKTVYEPARDWDLMEIDSIVVDSTSGRPGDCGGIIVSTTPKPKILGLYNGDYNRRMTGIILNIDDIAPLLDTKGFKDDFDRFLCEGDPVDMPHGEEATFVGRTIQPSPPCSRSELSDWRLSPFSEEFEIRMEPGPLSPYDDRITVELPRNARGQKSLLLWPNSEMCKAMPKLDQTLLDEVQEVLLNYFVVKMRPYLKATSNNIDEVVEYAINGDTMNEYVRGMEVHKSAGFPWTTLPGVGQKADFISVDEQTGVRSFNDGLGQVLKKRVYDKLSYANKGIRLKSFVASKLKDTTIKKEVVAVGKTRVFSCVPVESIIVDAGLYGNFKEAYTLLGTALNHGVSTNCHSTDWKGIYTYLNKFPNCVDIDYKNYDKYLHGQVIKAVYHIINNTIQRLAPDDWHAARNIAMEEAIYTYMVDFDTCYQTTRGNKSGSYLTTITNCIANLIYSVYCWGVIMKPLDYSLVEFFKYVCEVDYGDDKAMSISDKVIDHYNFFTLKEELSKLGHSITPGAKDGVERKFVPISEIIFLKRKFKIEEGMVIAPLETRSIESPFCWTKNLMTDVTIWHNLVKEQLMEAALHGEEYYDIFRNKLLRVKNEALLESIHLHCSIPWSRMMSKFRKRYFKSN